MGRLTLVRKVEAVGEKIVQYISLGVLLLLTVSNFIYTAHVSYDVLEKVVFSITPWYIIGALVLGCVFLIAFNFLIKKSEAFLFTVFSIAYGVGILYFILNIKEPMRADSLAVYYAAIELETGNYNSLLSGGYLSIYPNQLGLVTLERLLRNFSKNPEVFYFFGGICVYLINWFGYKITEECFHNASVNKIVICMEFMFFPQFFFIMFAYGLLPGFCCFTIAIYCTIKCLNEKKVIYGIITSFFMALSVLLKMNYLIGAIAIASYILLYFLRKKDWKDLLFSACVLIFSFAATSALSAYYYSETGVDIGKGTPATLWIAMGTNLDNDLKAPGWYDGYNIQIYTGTAELDSEKANDIAMDQIRFNMQAILKEPVRALHFYYKKIVSMWCEPMFQSVWSGPSVDSEKYVQQENLLSLYNGGNNEKFFAAFMKCFILIIFTLTLFYAFLHWKEQPHVWLMFIYLIGGFLFHLFWEGKSQYIYPYVFLLIPCCAYELYVIKDKIDRKVEEKCTFLSRFLKISLKK